MDAEQGCSAWGGCRPGGRLDMSHGFVRHIRRNQIARDDYDREMKQAKEKVKRRHTPAPARPRKPDQQVYHPSWRSKAETTSGLEYEGSSESSSSTEPDPNGPAVFCLEYEDDSGKITSIVVHQVCDPPGKSEVQAELQFEIDKQMVKEHLISLNEFKSPGPDELHPRVLKELAEELSEPPSIIFVKSRKNKS